MAPQAVPGWEVETVEGKLAQPVDLFGETVTEGVKQVTWTGGPLDPHQFTDFGISMKLPNTPGETLWFPVVQRCEGGKVTRWITIPVAGQEEPDTPAPGVELTAAAGATAAPRSPRTGGDRLRRGGGRRTDDEEEIVADEDRVNLALGLGAAGLVAGLAGLGIGLAGRRRRT